MSDSDMYAARLSQLVNTVGSVAVIDATYDDLMSTMKQLRAELVSLPMQLATAKSEKRELAEKLSLREATIVSQLDYKALGASNAEARNAVGKVKVNEDQQYAALYHRLLNAERALDALLETQSSINRQMNGCTFAAQLHASYITALSAVTVTMTVPVERVEAEEFDDDDDLEIDF